MDNKKKIELLELQSREDRDRLRMLYITERKEPESSIWSQHPCPTCPMSAYSMCTCGYFVCKNGHTFDSSGNVTSH